MILNIGNTAATVKYAAEHLLGTCQKLSLYFILVSNSTHKCASDIANIRRVSILLFCYPFIYLSHITQRAERDSFTSDFSQTWTLLPRLACFFLVLHLQRESRTSPALPLLRDHWTWLDRAFQWRGPRNQCRGACCDPRCFGHQR